MAKDIENSLKKSSKETFFMAPLLIYAPVTVVRIDFSPRLIHQRRSNTSIHVFLVPNKKSFNFE